MNQLSGRIQVLFVAALTGVLVALAVLVKALAGPVAVVAYAVVVLVLVGLAVRRARREPELPEGRTCTCCTSTVHDPVTVI